MAPADTPRATKVAIGKQGGFGANIGIWIFRHILGMIALGATQTATAAPVGFVSEPYGSSGGIAFRLYCGDRQAVRGFTYRAGRHFGQIALICSEVRDGKAVGQRLLTQAAGAGIGSDLGEQFESSCVNNNLIRSIEVMFEARQASAIKVQCQRSQERRFDWCISGTRYFCHGINPAVLDTAWRKWLVCPAGQVLVGLVGRAGNQVDAMGVICGERHGTGSEALAEMDARRATIPGAAPRVQSPLDVEPAPAVVRAKIGAPSLVGGAGDAARSAAGGCLPQYAFRFAGPTDRVCVSPQAVQRVAIENENGPVLVAPGGDGRTCRRGYVWREAFSQDTVCVSPEARAEAAEENRLAPSHQR